MKKIFTPRYVLVFVILLSVFSFSCKNMNEKKPEDNLIQRDKDPNARMTDMVGAMEYEFNLIKNPTTGSIPEGVFAAELAQAKQIVETQLINQRPSLANPYAFQGPDNLGGRTRTIAYDVRYDGGANQIILAGGVSGGVYKSIDNGATWVRTSPLGEHFACMSLAQDTRIGFRDTWYYCVGEGSGNSAGASGAGYSGNGVYKSTDNGSSWARLTASNTTALETFTVGQDYITKVIVDPTDGNVYAAAAATIRRSVDGGTTWTTVLSGTLSFSSNFTDIVVSSTGRLYASFGGTNSSTVDGVWASPPGISSGDAGSWTQIAGAGAGGSPVGWNAEGTYGRVVLAIPPSAETLLYALYSITVGACTVEAELFRWDDVGGTWTNLSATLPDEPGCLTGNDPFAVQGGYDLVVAVKPDAASTLFIGGTNSYRSTDAGLTWTRIGGYISPASYGLYPSSHPDVHSFVFQPGSPLIMLCGNDGGIQRTTDCTAGSVVWTQINSGYRTYQYYYVTLDPRVSNAKVLGGAQDNGSTRNVGGTGIIFESVMGGDGVSVGLSGASDFEYVGFQLGDIIRRTAGSGAGFGTLITPPGEAGTGLFVTLFKLDPDNTGNLYYANDNIIYRTTSASTVTSGTWTSMTGIATAVGAAFDVSAIATTRGVYGAGTASLFFGTSNGRVFRLDDPAGVAAATAPVEISLGAGFPAAGAGNISSIAVNPRNDDTVLVTFSNYGITSVYWTGTANLAAPTWTAVEGLLTLPSFRSSAIVLNGLTTPKTVEYYVGTSVGLYASIGLPGATGWLYAPPLPTTGQEGASSLGFAVVSSIALRPVDNRLLIGTHGYGMWATTIPTAPLPVILTEFKGILQNNKTALLQWSTSAEYDSKHFELEKSIDGNSYRRIATLAAAGNSSITRNYSYTDREPLTEKNYYRLKSVDIDNDFKVSNVVLLKLSGVSQDMLVLGNPFRNSITVRFIKPPETKGELKLTDMAGRLVARQVFGQGEQLVQFTIPPEKTARGAYLLQAFINGQTYTTRVLKE